MQIAISLNLANRFMRFAQGKILGRGCLAMKPDSGNRSRNVGPTARVAPELYYCAESDTLFIDLPSSSQPVTYLQPIQLTVAARIAPDGRLVGLMLRSLSQMSNQPVSHSGGIPDGMPGRSRK